MLLLGLISNEIWLKDSWNRWGFWSLKKHVKSHIQLYHQSNYSLSFFIFKICKRGEKNYNLNIINVNLLGHCSNFANLYIFN